MRAAQATPLGFHELPNIAPCFFNCSYRLHPRPDEPAIRRRYSLISARMYLAFFISFDVVSIVIQAVGGASPSKAGAEDSYIPE